MSVKNKKLYKSSGKCDYQQQYKAIIEVAMVFTTDGFTNNTPISPGPYVTVKNPRASKLLHQFSEVLDFKQNTAIRRLVSFK